MTLFRGLFTWLLSAWVTLDRLERECAEYGTLSLQQVHNGAGLEWWSELRASGELRYCWKGHGPTIRAAIADALADARKYPIGAKPALEHAPRLGGKEFDA